MTVALGASGHDDALAAAVEYLSLAVLNIFLNPCFIAYINIFAVLNGSRLGIFMPGVGSINLSVDNQICLHILHSSVRDYIVTILKIGCTTQQIYNIFRGRTTCVKKCSQKILLRAFQLCCSGEDS